MLSRHSLLCCILTILLQLPAVHCLGKSIPTTSIDHQPEGQAYIGFQVPVNVQISDPQGIKIVRCYFRYQHETNHVYVEAVPAAGNTFQAILPAPKNDVNSIEYCFLVRNGSRQVLRSPWYQVKVIANTSGHPIYPQDTGLEVKTEMLLPGSGQVSQGGTGQLAVETTDSLWLGMVGGVHRLEDFKAIKTVSGHFGGYVQDTPGEPFEPLEGFLPLHLPGESPSLPKSSIYKSAPSPPNETSAKEGYDYAGPNIDGDDWEGAFYIAPDGDDYDRITASIYQRPYSSAADFFEVVTSLEEGPAQILKGFIYPSGYLWAADAEDDQVWTTHDQTKLTTSGFFYIADYVNPDKSDDTYVIELEREPPPPPPPPPIEAIDGFQAILFLLL